MPNLTVMPAAFATTLGCVFFGIQYMHTCHAKDYRRGFWYKGLAALCFVLTGLLFRNDSPASHKDWILLGLILGMAADEVLILRRLLPNRHTLMFGLGTAVFAAGHLFYLKSLHTVHSLSLPVLLPVYLVLLFIGNVYGKQQESHAGKLQPAAVFYMALVIFMAAASVSTAICQPNPATLFFALGGVLFAVSDNVLFAYSFGNTRSWNQNILVHITYYAAQLFIAWSVFY